MLRCNLFAYSTSPHASQIYTGLSILSRTGAIKLTQTLQNYRHHGTSVLEHLQPNALNGVFAVLNDKHLLFYDTSDDNSLRIEALEIADAYFKRSYDIQAIPYAYRQKVFPLGFNYEIYTGKIDRHEFVRALGRKTSTVRRFKNTLQYLAELSGVSFCPSVSNMSAPPKPDQEPRVLFMVRAWDPMGEMPGESLPDDQMQQRESINETRARCIELLRKELGTRFFGGFYQSSYGRKRFSHLLLENALISSKKNYISLLHQYPICIATTGLHGSAGWKMGEYVAFSKCIVSEKLNFSVPGHFSSDQHYLEFASPELLVHQVIRLVEDQSMRQFMMESNWNYFANHLRPDTMMMNTLHTAIYLSTFGDNLRTVNEEIHTEC